MTESLLTPKQACEKLQIKSLDTLYRRIREGVVKAKNINPHGKRAVWRIIEQGLTDATENSKTDVKYLALKRRCGL